MHDWHVRGIAAAVILLLCLGSSTLADDEWFWRRGDDPDTVKRTRAELDSLLSQQRFVQDTAGAELRLLDLRGAILDNADLSRISVTKVLLDSASLDGVNLYRANLIECSCRGASLANAVLSHGNFFGTDFTGAYMVGCEAESTVFIYADLDTVYLMKANLSKSDFTRASMQNADLFGARLDSADFSQSDLAEASMDRASARKALFKGTLLNEARMFRTDLTEAVFRPATVPKLWPISFAEGLRTLNPEFDPEGLTKLRQAFHDGGFTQAEREVICALRRHDQNWLETWAFDYTCQWGSDLKRPWYLLLGITALCVLVYYVVMLFGKGHSLKIEIPLSVANAKHIGHGGPNELIDDDGKKVLRIPLNRTSPSLANKGASNLTRRFPMCIRLVWWAVFFSAMSALNIGFRDINFGRWLRKLSRYEFDIRASGVVRVISGFQALLSVYLIALWILSWSGTPFK